MENAVNSQHAMKNNDWIKLAQKPNGDTFSEPDKYMLIFKKAKDILVSP